MNDLWSQFRICVEGNARALRGELLSAAHASDVARACRRWRVASASGTKGEVGCTGRGKENGPGENGLREKKREMAKEGRFGPEQDFRFLNLCKFLSF